MNLFDATIIDCVAHGRFNYLRVDANGVPFHVVTLELEPAFAIGARVELMIKESEIGLVRHLTCGETSIDNLLPCQVVGISNGALFCDVQLQATCGPFHAVVLRSAVDRMALRAGDALIALIKAADISLMRVVHD